MKKSLRKLVKSIEAYSNCAYSLGTPSGRKLLRTVSYLEAEEVAAIIDSMLDRLEVMQSYNEEIPLLEFEALFPRYHRPTSFIPLFKNCSEEEGVKKGNVILQYVVEKNFMNSYNPERSVLG